MSFRPARRPARVPFVPLASRRRPAALALLAGATLGLGGCSSAFFQVTPKGEEPGARPVERPARPAPVAADSARRAASPRAVPTEAPSATPPRMIPPAAPRAAPAAVPVVPPVAPPVEDVGYPDPEPVPSDAAGIARLARIGALREALLLHHPAAATRAGAFDSALVRLLPGMRSAPGDSVLATIIARLVRVLDTAHTVVALGERPVTGGLPPASGRVAARHGFAWTADSVLVLSAPGDAMPDSGVLAAAARIAPLARHVVVDVRAARPVDAAAAARSDAAFAASGLFAVLNDGAAVAPSLRSRRHDGAVASWQVVAGDALDARAAPTPVPVEPAPPRRGRGRPTVPPPPVPRRVVVIANAAGAVPGGAQALVHAGRATLVAEDGVSPRAQLPTARVAVGEAITVEFPVAELVQGDGSAGLRADTVVASDATPPGDTAAVVRAALAIVRSGRAPRAVRPAAAWTSASPFTGPAADSVPYPPMGARLLAGFRVWTAARALHVHRDLYDRDPDEVLAEVLPRLEGARDAVEYARAVAELASVLDDSQGRLAGPGAAAAFGAASAPFLVRLVEGRAIVTAVAPDSEAIALGVRTGDEIVAADGFPVPAWLSDRRHRVPASNDWARARDLAALLSRGEERPASYRVRDAAGAERQLMVPRRAAWRGALVGPERPGTTAARTLPGGVLYVDAERATDAAVAALLDTSTAARALLVDLRGTVGADSVLRARLLRETPEPGARVATRSLVAPCLDATVRAATVACVQERREATEWVAGRGPRFAGRVVVLVDERTQGRAERLALHLDAGARVTFAGSPTAGALGAVALVPLPGGLVLPVTVEEVRRGDGGQVQRLGITPMVEFRPTVRGARNGGDEVLERAHQWLLQQLDPPARRRR